MVRPPSCRWLPGRSPPLRLTLGQRLTMLSTCVETPWEQHRFLWVAILAVELLPPACARDISMLRRRVLGAVAPRRPLILCHHIALHLDCAPLALSSLLVGLPVPAPALYAVCSEPRLGHAGSSALRIRLVLVSNVPGLLRTLSWLPSGLTCPSGAGAAFCCPHGHGPTPLVCTGRPWRPSTRQIAPNERRRSRPFLALSQVRNASLPETPFAQDARRSAASQCARTVATPLLLM